MFLSPFPLKFFYHNIHKARLSYKILPQNQVTTYVVSPTEVSLYALALSFFPVSIRNEIYLGYPTVYHSRVYRLKFSLYLISQVQSRLYDFSAVLLGIFNLNDKNLMFIFLAYECSVDSRRVASFKKVIQNRWRTR